MPQFGDMPGKILETGDLHFSRRYCLCVCVCEKRCIYTTTCIQWLWDVVLYMSVTVRGGLRLSNDQSQVNVEKV